MTGALDCSDFPPDGDGGDTCEYPNACAGTYVNVLNSEDAEVCRQVREPDELLQDCTSNHLPTIGGKK